MLAILACLVTGMWGVPEISPAIAQSVVEISPGGDAITISGEDEQGWYKGTIPIHRSAGIRYFSAGVGLEERDAEYPPFPLKLVLVAGPRAYLSSVSITITGERDGMMVEIPEEHVAGPWVFVDLPAGVYRITAYREGDPREKTGIAIDPAQQRKVYLRWP